MVWMTISFFIPSVSGRRCIWAGIAAGDAGCGLQEQSTGRAAGDHGRLCADQSGDLLAGPAVEFVDIDHDAGGAGHLLQHLGPGAGAAEAGNGARGVDDGSDAEVAIGLFGISEMFCWVKGASR